MASQPNRPADEFRSGLGTWWTENSECFGISQKVGFRAAGWTDGWHARSQRMTARTQRTGKTTLGLGSGAWRVSCSALQVASLVTFSASLIVKTLAGKAADWAIDKTASAEGWKGKAGWGALAGTALAFQALGHATHATSLTILVGTGAMTLRPTASTNRPQPEQTVGVTPAEINRMVKEGVEAELRNREARAQASAPQAAAPEPAAAARPTTLHVVTPGEPQQKALTPLATDTTSTVVSEAQLQEANRFLGIIFKVEDESRVADERHAIAQGRDPHQRELLLPPRNEAETGRPDLRRRVWVNENSAAHWRVRLETALDMAGVAPTLANRKALNELANLHIMTERGERSSRPPSGGFAKMAAAAAAALAQAEQEALHARQLTTAREAFTHREDMLKCEEGAATKDYRDKEAKRAGYSPDFRAVMEPGPTGALRAIWALRGSPEHRAALAREALRNEGLEPTPALLGQLGITEQADARGHAAHDPTARAFHHAAQEIGALAPPPVLEVEDVRVNRRAANEDTYAADPRAAAAERAQAFGARVQARGTRASQSGGATARPGVPGASQQLARAARYRGDPAP